MAWLLFTLWLVMHFARLQGIHQAGLALLMINDVQKSQKDVISR